MFNLSCIIKKSERALFEPNQNYVLTLEIVDHALMTCYVFVDLPVTYHYNSIDTNFVYHKQENYAALKSQKLIIVQVYNQVCALMGRQNPRKICFKKEIYSEECSALYLFSLSVFYKTCFV